GDVYEDSKAGDIPQSLMAATGTLRNSAFLREVLGDDVVDHYTRAAEWEQEEFDRAVTDWEIARGFERA
ncbi:MAG: glutamine synthetase, partial [Rhodobacterales bacterium]